MMVNNNNAQTSNLDTQTMDDMNELFRMDYPSSKNLLNFKN